MNPPVAQMEATPDAPASGLTPEHKAALDQSFQMMSRGASNEDAVEHLTQNGMPRLVAKVLVKQYRNCK